MLRNPDDSLLGMRRLLEQTSESLTLLGQALAEDCRCDLFDSRSQQNSAPLVRFDDNSSENKLRMFKTVVGQISRIWLGQSKKGIKRVAFGRTQAKRARRLVASTSRKALDSSMQVRLLSWIDRQLQNGAKPTNRQIRQMAVQMSRVKGFKASKGWYEKFEKRHGVKQKLSSY